MKKNLTELVFILDRSGSMRGLEADTIGGYNSLLDRQKLEEGEVIVSTVLFDDMQEVLHDRVDIKNIEPMTRKEYYVRGCTALLDAVGGASRAVNYECDSAGTQLNYQTISEAVSRVRACASREMVDAVLNDDWKAEIEEDYRMRHRK